MGTNKGSLDTMVVRSRIVARGCKCKDEGRDDLFADTPPLESLRLLLSRVATRKVGRKGGRRDGGEEGRIESQTFGFTHMVLTYYHIISMLKETKILVI